MLNSLSLWNAGHQKNRRNTCRLANVQKVKRCVKNQQKRAIEKEKDKKEGASSRKSDRQKTAAFIAPLRPCKSHHTSFPSSRMSR
jgi:hypothetical protein